MNDESDINPRICFWEPFSLDEIDREDNNSDKYIDDEDDEFEMAVPNIKLFKGIITPGGVFPLSSTNNFNIWVLHTNFRISKDDVKKISEVEGVELIRPFSRYRIQITFGTLFCDDCVKRDIETVLGAEVNHNKDIELTAELKERVDLAKRSISDKQHWLIYVGANGQIKTFSTDERNSELYEKAELFEKLYEATGGILYCSPNIF